MDKKKILEEGLLERHLMGDLDLEQHTAVAATIEKDPSLKKAYGAMEEDFERMAFENAVAPPSQIRKSLEVVLNAMEGDPEVRHLVMDKERQTKIQFRLMVAASMAALFAISSFWLYSRWQDSEKNLQMVQRQTSELQNRLAGLENDYRQTNSKYQTINNPNVQPFLLVGNQKLPNSRAIAYVNHQTKEVLLNTKGLPKLSADKTYQLWADVDGEMIDMGILPGDNDLVSMNYIDRAESLNITIEPAGGSEHPTVENLVANVFI
ncbi:MAG: anti-sigma factor [Flavobacteriaceae bacterium]